MFTEERLGEGLWGDVLRAKQSTKFSVKKTNHSLWILHIDLTYSCLLTKAIIWVYIHCLLLYNQACSFNRKRLEQIQQSASLTFSVMACTTQLNYHLSNICVLNLKRNYKCCWFCLISLFRFAKKLKHDKIQNTKKEIQNAKKARANG